MSAGITAATALTAAATIGGAYIASEGAKSAAETQAGAGQQATVAQQQMFQQQQDNLAPWQQTGKLALSDLATFMGIGGPTGIGGTGTAPGVAGFKYDPAKDPMAQFMMQQGASAITNQRSALGGVNSGATLKALSDYGQQTAASSYQQEFNNWNTQLNNLFNRLSGVSGTGANVAGGVAGLGMGAANQIGGNIMGIGNAQAAGQIGQANALQGLIQNPNITNLFGQKSSIPTADINAANMSVDPISALNTSQGWTF